MPPVNVLVKPASSACNMECSYCFYRDVAANRERGFEGMMSAETAEHLVAAAMEYAEGGCTFTFQGGEPTLAGLDFYHNFLRFEKKYAKPGVSIQNSIQTNGYLINDEWAAFLRDNRFLTGLSLDGPADIHDFNRTDRMGKGTFNRTMQAARLLEKHGVPYNILCVITGRNARSIEKIYRFFVRQGFRYLQLIPCLDPLGEERGQAGYHLSCKEYEAFLLRIFDLWLSDLRAGRYISIRHIDNWLSVLMGRPPESCNMNGHCSIQFVVEGDGGVYPCDFYVLDEWRLGTVGEDRFAGMLNSTKAQEFIRASLSVPQECKVCPYHFICRNGCRRDRTDAPDGTFGLNYYFEAYKNFFDKRARQLNEAILLLRRGRPHR